MLIGRYHALGRTLGPAWAAGGNGGRRETQSWHSICLHLKAGRSREDRGPTRRWVSTLWEGRKLALCPWPFTVYGHFHTYLHLIFTTSLCHWGFNITTFQKRKMLREEVSCSRSHTRKQAGTRSQVPWPCLVSMPGNPSSSGPTAGLWAPSFLRTPWFCSVIIDTSLRISLSLCLTGKHEKKKQEATEVIQVRTHSLINLANSLNTRYVKSTVRSARFTAEAKNHGPWYQEAYILVEEKDSEQVNKWGNYRV